MGKILIVVGTLAIIIGILLVYKIPIPFGRLPGDISIKGEHVQFYFPIATCIVLSILFSVLYYLFFGK
jgi:uncharacterized membrane protein